MTGIEVDNMITSLPIFTCKKCSSRLKLPIILVRGIGNVCGVCRETYNENLQIHNEHLEMVFQNLTIPCKYTKNNCSKKLKYSEMENHELVCNYRDFICPLKALRNCSWALNLSLLQDHFIKDHKDDIEFKPRPCFIMVVNVTKNYETIKLLRYCTNLFILYLHCNIDDSIFQCALYQIRNEKGILTCYYTITYQNSCYIENVSTLAEDEGFTGYFNTDKVVDVKLSDNYKPTIDISIEINDENFITSPTIDRRLLKEFECPICNYYMKPPIFHCLRGHNVCNVCKLKLHNCATCGVSFGETRNYLLEEFGNYVNFPCMYREQGCNVIEMGYRITKHEQECSLLIYNCPTNGCTWTGMYNNMLDHVLTHSHAIECSFYVGKISLDGENFTFYMIAYDRLFCGSINFNIQRTYYGTGYQTSWIVQLIGPKHEAKLFKYEFSLIRSNCIDNKFTFSNICQEYPENPLYTDRGPFKIPDKIIQQFKIDGRISFSCRIVNIVYSF